MNEIATTTISSWRATITSNLENAGQGHYLQKALYLSYCMTGFYQISFRSDGNVVGNKNITSADLANVGHGQSLQKSLYLGYYVTDLTNLSPK